MFLLRLSSAGVNGVPGDSSASGERGLAGEDCSVEMEAREVRARLEAEGEAASEGESMVAGDEEECGWGGLNVAAAA